MHNASCPCGSGDPFERCCGPCLDGSKQPATAESLMRSRYTAFTQTNENYLLQTWHPSTRPPTLDLTQQAPVKWLGLKILRTEAGGPGDDTGVVEFVARFKVNGKAQRLHETSQFRKAAGRWLYVNGSMTD